MYIPTFMRHRSDEDGSKQPRQHHDGEDDDDHHQQQHRSHCLERSKLPLLLLSLLLVVAAIGTGFFFANILSAANILHSSEKIRPIITGTTNANTNSNNNKQNNESLSFTTSTTEEFVLFAKGIYQDIVKKYATTTPEVVAGSVHEDE
jgi:uncharacterized protein HemX